MAYEECRRQMNRQLECVNARSARTLNRGRSLGTA